MSKKYYKSLDTLPIYNFDQCKKGNYQFLYYGNIDELPEKYPSTFVNMFMKLIYTLNHVDTDMVDLLYKIAKFDNKYAATKDKKFLNKKNMLQYEYDEKLKKTETQDFWTQVGIVEKHMNRDINVYTCSTNKFLGYVHSLKLSRNG